MRSRTANVTSVGQRAVARPTEGDAVSDLGPRRAESAEPPRLRPGLSFCLGAPLVRVELRVALATVIPRCPGLALAADPVLRSTFMLRGDTEVRVRR